MRQLPVSTATISVFLLVLARTGAWVVAAPVLSAKGVSLIGGLALAFALALFVAQFGFRNNLVRKVMEAQIKLPEAVWAKVGYAWMSFFALVGVLNLVMAFVVFKDNTGAWVSFKLFGVTGIFFAFIVIQTLMLSKHIQEQETGQGDA